MAYKHPRLGKKKVTRLLPADLRSICQCSRRRLSPNLINRYYVQRLDIRRTVRYGRGAGVPRGLGVGVALPRGVVVGVGDGVGDGPPPLVVRKIVPLSPTAMPVTVSLAKETLFKLAELPLF